MQERLTTKTSCCCYAEPCWTMLNLCAFSHFSLPCKTLVAPSIPWIHWCVRSVLLALIRCSSKWRKGESWICRVHHETFDHLSTTNQNVLLCKYMDIWLKYTEIPHISYTHNYLSSIYLSLSISTILYMYIYICVCATFIYIYMYIGEFMCLFDWII